MLTFKSSEETHNTCFKFIGADSAPKTTHLISNNTSLIAPSMNEGGADSCSFYSGPSDATIMAFGESCGSIASASVSVSSGSSFSGGSFSSYSC